MQKDYAKFLVKSFTHWEVYVHEHQYYLGRVYVWAKRDEVVDFFDMSEEEKEEFFMIGRLLRKTLSSLFSPNLFNYAALGNISTHLHVHVIPRYKEKRMFESMEFVDERWGKNYAPYNYEFKVSEGVLLRLRDVIGEEMKKYV